MVGDNAVFDDHRVKMMYAHVNKKNGEPAPLVSDELYNTVMEVWVEGGHQTPLLECCVCVVLPHTVYNRTLLVYSMLSASTA